MSARSNVYRLAIAGLLLSRAPRWAQHVVGWALFGVFVAIVVIVLAMSARTAEEEPWVQQQQMPPFLAQEDWCLERPTSPPSRGGFGAASTYKAVPGCRSFVVKQDTLVWNGNVSCKITSIAELGGNWWLRGHCSDGIGASYVGDFRFAEGRIGGEHVLIQLTPPYAATAY
jgi:hypothetical protein